MLLKEQHRCKTILNQGDCKWEVLVTICGHDHARGEGVETRVEGVDSTTDYVFDNMFDASGTNDITVENDLIPASATETRQ